MFEICARLVVGRVIIDTYSVHTRLATKTPKKFVVMNVKLDPKMKVALAKAAARDGQTSSAVVRKLLADYLRAQGLWK